MRFLAVSAALVISLLHVDALAQSEHSAANAIASLSRGKLAAKLRSDLSLADLYAVADAAEKSMVSEEYEAAAQMFEAVIAAPGFAQFDPDRQHFVLIRAAEVASLRSDYTRAHTLYSRSSGHALADREDWIGRLNAAWFVGDYDDAVAALLRVARTWPEELDFISQWAVDALVDHARGTPGDAEFTLLSALFDSGWETDLGLEPTRLWMRFIEILVERDQIARALNVSSRLRDPLAVVTLLSDTRFAPVIAAAPDWFDVRETLDAGIIEARLAVEANPHLLAPAVMLAESLLRAGRPQESLLVLDAQLTRSALKTLVGEALEDALTESVRALTTKALALIALERWDEAGEQLAVAAQQSVPEYRSGDYFSVALLQARLGLPEDALKTLRQVAPGADDPQADLVRFIVAQTQRNARAADAALEALLAAEDGAAAQAQRALLIAGHVDEAAELLIRRLNDPLQRGSALLEIQSMREQPWPEPTLDWRAGVGSLMSRDDVRRSVAATGARIAEYAIHRWN